METITRSAGEMYLSRDDDAPELYAVWLHDDILGSGATPEEAFAGARETLQAWKASRAAEKVTQAPVRPVSFSDGPWSGTTRDDGFSYCPTFMFEQDAHRCWVIHFNRDERTIAAFWIDPFSDDLEEQAVERCDIPPGWSFTEVVGAVKYLCTEKALPEVSLGLVAQMFFAKGW
jgi:hypothetical protein